LGRELRFLWRATFAQYNRAGDSGRNRVPANGIFLWSIPDIFAIKGFLKKLALCLKNADPTSETRIVEQRLYTP
jgi:hypothetical protein